MLPRQDKIRVGIKDLLAVIAHNFIWSGDVGIKKIVTVSWSQICAPKDEGGLGLRHLKFLNSAALLTMGWRVLTSNSAWGVFARSRFSIFHHMKSPYLCSSLWHGLRVSLPILFQNSKWLIGDGNSVKFWSDKWLDVPIVDKLHITISSAHLSSTVAAFISDQNWVLSARFRQAFPDLVKDIMLVLLPMESTNDTLIWEHSSDGVLSFSSAYDQLRPNFSSPPWAFTVWQDQTHLFFNCSFAQHIWQWLACCFGTSLSSTGSLFDLWDSFKHKAFSAQLRNLWLAGGLYVLMAIWKSRNKLRFENKKPSLMRVFRSIKAWLQFLAPHAPVVVS
ncbi:hypothetical protein ACLB2K_056833 [Fragaria x ananassa]